MKERHKSRIQEYEEEVELGRVIAERFKAERYPEASVDGEDRWALDPFEEEPEC